MFGNRAVPALAAVLACSAVPRSPLAAAQPSPGADGPGLPVSGRGVHLFSTAIVHSKEATPNGRVQRSTETVELEGDLVGRVLYHPTSVFDFAQGTLVNTGHQVFSGTVLGSAPVLIHDDAFRFDVDLDTGATVGDVHLTDSLAGPKVRCHLRVVGTGMTPEGNATVEYTGECRFRGR
jgi:hypothetical protein